MKPMNTSENAVYIYIYVGNQRVTVNTGCVEYGSLRGQNLKVVMLDCA